MKEHGFDTYNEIYEKIAWSFTIAAYGVHPEHGLVFAGGELMTLLFLTGDLDFLSNDLLLKFLGSIEWCFCCTSTCRDDPLKKQRRA